MNSLSNAKKVLVLTCLAEGNSIRSTERITGVRRDTILRLLETIARKCERVSNSFVERQNLTMRMQMRRFTRLTNGFSKKLKNLKSALALHFFHYNFMRIHQALSVTPAMEAGITNHIWTWEELCA